VFVFIIASVVAAGRADDSADLPLNERAFIASKIYALANTYFAHWSAVPDLDFDSAYKSYLSRALAAKDRREFDLLTIEFVEGLHNAHTRFSDDWLVKNYGQPLGFRAKRIEAKWVITNSDRTGLKPGDIIQAIDGSPIGTFLKEREKYRFARKGLEGQGVLWSPYLFPERFTIRLQSGREVVVDRQAAASPAPQRATEGRWLKEGKVAYIAIPSFGDAKFEKAAVDFVRQYKQAEALIIDVRGNGGGSTPQQLIDAIMNRPYRDAREATPLQIGAVQTWRDLPRQFDLSNQSDYARGGIDAFSDFDNPQFIWGGGTNKPKANAFAGRIFILADRQCASACEDFVLPFKDNHRATIVGEQTWGSTGQPYIYNFGNGMMVFISTKRLYLPDGSEFEGIGVRPDVEVPLTISDVVKGRDAVMGKAVQLSEIGGNK
jgi:carboxyl-terminal processing protease